MSIKFSFNLHRNDFHMEVDLSLPDTGVTAIFGPSGSGKTTLLRAIAGLEHIPGGLVSFQNNIWQDETKFIPAHKRAIGYVFQEPSLFSHLTVQQNLEFGLKRIPVQEQKIALDSVIETLNIGMLLERKPHSLSGGEQQRVAIGRTLAASPKLLLMDEPLSSLDNKLKLEILPYLESLQKEFSIPVLYVSHATDEVARLADTLVILKDGKILGSGSIHDMLTRLDLPLAHRRDAETLIEGTVSEVDKDYGLTTVECNQARFTVIGDNLAPGNKVRLRIAAQDVSLTLEKNDNTSILNIFPVTVDEFYDEGLAQIMVRLILGDASILARITRKSAESLDISAGKQLYAQMKSVAVLA